MATSSLKLLHPTSKRQRLLRILGIFAVTVFLCAFLDLGAFAPLEQFADNLRITSFAKRDDDFDRWGHEFDRWAREHIVVVTRSDDSFDELRGLRLPRTYHAKLIRDLTRAGAKVIAFDYLFSSSTPEDDDFAAAAKASGKVVWGGVLEDQNPDSPAPPQFLKPTAKLFEASSYFGHIRAPIDQEMSQVTRIPALLYDGKTPVPAFSLQIARLALGLQNAPLIQASNAIHVGPLTIPIGNDGSFQIKYLGAKPGEVFQTIPYENIYGGAVDLPFYKKNHYFKDKIILIGDVTKAGNDHRATPLGEMTGVEIHAHAVATLLRGSFFKDAPAWVNLALIFGAAALTCPLVAHWRAPIAAMGVLVLFLAQLYFNVYFLAEHKIAIHLIAPSAAILFSTLGVLIERSLTVERDKHRAQALLQRYLSPQIANYVLQNPEKCFLGGDRVHATVLFSDIRGFTALSETMQPEDVLGRLNEYFEAMTQTVFLHDGAVDKYIGDAIMALFGAPMPHPDHAKRAVRAALEMQTALLKLQEKWKEEGLPNIDIGIGINTGEMVFGNMGASGRMDLSVLGDSVNLASRVESLNKEMGSRILITAATYELVKDEVEVRGPLTTTVKGKSEEVTVYEVVGQAKVRH